MADELPVARDITVSHEPDNRVATAVGTADVFRPAVLAHQGKALGVVQQRREIDQVQCSLLA